MITGVESTFEEVTVDSLSFKSKNELETRLPMIRQHCRCSGQGQHSARCDDPASPYRSRTTPSESHGLDSIPIGEGLPHAAQFKKLYPKCRKGPVCAGARLSALQIQSSALVETRGFGRDQQRLLMERGFA